jgi:V/A-type H+-transporting ATPase subunit B
MTVAPRVAYASLAEIRGPLLIVEGVSGVGWDEVAEVRMGSGERRNGVVLDVHGDTAVVEVLEGTSGMRLDDARVSFSGTPMTIPVGPAWLGRVCNGRGEPVDGGPPITGTASREIAGRPINPCARAVPREAILTGVSAVDGLASLVRGQKLPIFSVGGLPHLELASQIAAQASAGDEPFAVVFAAMGVTHADAAAVRDALEERSASGDLALLLNTADDPTVERIVTPRIALTIAEHLAFDLGRHVLVIMADLTSYCDALREVSAARGEIPSRRGYPGYLYSDLASLLERAGRIEGRPGSITQVPVLTMPAGDMTHPVPDVTGYITEGQIVLSPELDRRGVYPPFDALGSLSRLMRLGAGAERTRDDHLDIAAQLYGLVAQAHQIADLAEIIGEDALSAGEQRYLGFAEAFEREFLAQGRSEARTIDETLDRAWAVASHLPRSDLSMVGASALEEHYRDDAAHPAG